MENAAIICSGSAVVRRAAWIYAFQQVIGAYAAMGVGVAMLIDALLLPPFFDRSKQVNDNAPNIVLAVGGLIFLELGASNITLRSRN